MCSVSPLVSSDWLAGSMVAGTLDHRGVLKGSPSKQTDVFAEPMVVFLLD